VLEDKIAKKLADLFSDNRINVCILATLSRRYFSHQTNQTVEEWWDLHKAEPSTYLDSATLLALDPDSYSMTR
jgi:hypothetical protein